MWKFKYNHRHHVKNGMCPPWGPWTFLNNNLCISGNIFWISEIPYLFQTHCPVPCQSMLPEWSVLLSISAPLSVVVTLSSHMFYRFVIYRVCYCVIEKALEFSHLVWIHVYTTFESNWTESIFSSRWHLTGSFDHEIPLQNLKPVTPFQLSQ